MNAGSKRDDAVNPLVQELLAGTNGLAYRHLVRPLESYPVPPIRLPEGRDKLLLDVGCGWGRWSLAAARRGYMVVGMDPNLRAVRAAAQVAAQLGLNDRIRFVVADARCLPFRGSTFDVVYSYSVLQHFGDCDVTKIAVGIGSLLKRGGESMIQMATAFGLRSIYHQVARRFREPVEFEVRYRTVPALLRTFTKHLGVSHLSADCYFGLGIQEGDTALMPVWLRVIFRASGFLQRASIRLPWMVFLADSVFVRSRKTE